MAGVLVLLCIFFSAVTLRDSRPSGAEAAEAVANGLSSSRGASPVLIVARDTDEDRRFAEGLDRALTSAGG